MENAAAVVAATFGLILVVGVAAQAATGFPIVTGTLTMTALDIQRTLDGLDAERNLVLAGPGPRTLELRQDGERALVAAPGSGPRTLEFR